MQYLVRYRLIWVYLKWIWEITEELGGIAQFFTTKVHQNWRFYLQKNTIMLFELLKPFLSMVIFWLVNIKTKSCPELKKPSSTATVRPCKDNH